MKVLIVHDRLEQKIARTRDKKEYFSRVVTNEPDQLRFLEGLPFREVWITEEVLLHGMHVDVLDRCVRTLVRMSVDPARGFRLFFIGGGKNDGK